MTHVRDDVSRQSKRRKVKSLWTNSRCKELLSVTHSPGFFPLLLRGRRAVYSCNAQTRRVTFRDFTRICRRLCRRVVTDITDTTTAALLLRGSARRRPIKTEKETMSRHVTSRHVASQHRVSLCCVVGRAQWQFTSSGVYISLFLFPAISNAAISQTTPCLSACVTRYMYSRKSGYDCDRIRASHLAYCRHACMRLPTNVVTRIDGVK